MLENDINQVLKSIMPVNADIELKPKKSQYEAHISWLVNKANDPRPNKRSRLIILKILDDVFQDFSDLSENKKKHVINKITLYLNKRYEAFNPESDGFTLSPDEWVVDGEVAGLLD